MCCKTCPELTCWGQISLCIGIVYTWMIMVSIWLSAQPVASHARLSVGGCIARSVKPRTGRTPCTASKFTDGHKHTSQAGQQHANRDNQPSQHMKGHDVCISSRSTLLDHGRAPSPGPHNPPTRFSVWRGSDLSHLCVTLAVVLDPPTPHTGWSGPGLIQVIDEPLS